MPAVVKWSARYKLQQKWHEQVESDHDDSDDPHYHSESRREVERKQVTADRKLYEEHRICLQGDRYKLPVYVVQRPLRCPKRVRFETASASLYTPKHEGDVANKARSLRRISDQMLRLRKVFSPTDDLLSLQTSTSHYYPSLVCTMSA